MAFLVSPTPPLPVPVSRLDLVTLSNYDNDLYRVLRKYLSEMAYRVNDLLPKDGSEPIVGSLGLTIKNFTGPVQPTPGGNYVPLHAAGEGLTSRTVLDSHVDSVGGHNLTFRKSRGTAAAPTAVTTNDQIMNIAAFGYGSTGYSTSLRGGIVITATQTWTDAAQGTQIALQSTPFGTNFPVNSLLLNGNTATFSGTVTLGGGTDISPDASASGHLRFAGNAYTGYATLDAVGMHIGHNSSVRNLTLDINETATATLTATNLSVPSLTIRSNIVTTTTDLALTDNANIATNADMNFYIDSDNNTTTAQFNWRKDAPFQSGHTDLMTLNELGLLTVKGQTVGDVLVRGDSAGEQIHINRTSSTVNSNIRYQTTAGSVYAGHGTANTFVIGSSNNLSASANQWLTVDATKVGLVTGQLQFPSTQVPSADATTLDDYRENTWTPTIAGTTTAGAGTYTVNTGSYIKVGRLVFFTADIQWTAHTGTGNMQVNGLPFSNGGQFAVVLPEPQNINLTANNIMTAAIAVSSSSIQLRQIAVGGGGVVSLVPMDTAGILRISGWYMAAN